MPEKYLASDMYRLCLRNLWFQHVAPSRTSSTCPCIRSEAFSQDDSFLETETFLASAISGPCAIQTCPPTREAMKTKIWEQFR